MDSLQEIFMELIPYTPRTFMGISKAVLAFIIFLCMAFLASESDKLDELIFNVWLKHALAIDCAWMEPVLLGTIVLLTIVAVLAATVFNIMSVTQPGDIWSRSTLGQAFKDDGVHGMLQAVRRSMVSYFRQSLLGRLYRWLTSHREVVYAAALVLLVFLYLAHRELGPSIYTYVAGLEAGFNSMSGVESPHCRYVLDSYPPRLTTWSYYALHQVYCAGELDGLAMQAEWDLFVREQLSNLDFLVYISKIAGILIAVAFILAGLVYRGTYFGRMVETNPRSPAPATAQDAVQTGDVNETESRETGVGEDDAQPSSETDDQLLGGQQREPEQPTAPAASTSTQTEEVDQSETIVLRNKVEELESATRLAVERQAEAERKCEEVSASLVQARKNVCLEETEKLILSDKFNAFRQLVNKTADQGLLKYFDEFDELVKTQEEHVEHADLTERRMFYRRIILQDFPALLENAVAFQASEQEKAANVISDLQEEGQKVSVSLEEERDNRRTLESQYEYALTEGRRLFQSASEDKSQLEALRQQHAELQDAYSTLEKGKDALAEQLDAAEAQRVSDVAAKEEELNESKQRCDDVVQELLHYCRADKKMSEEIRKRYGLKYLECGDMVTGGALSTLPDAPEEFEEADEADESADIEMADTPDSSECTCSRATEQESALTGAVEQLQDQVAANDANTIAAHAPAAEQLGAETRNNPHTLQHESARCAERELALNTQLQQANQQLVLSVTMAAATEQAHQRQMAEMAERERTAQEELARTKQVMHHTANQAAQHSQVFQKELSLARRQVADCQERARVDREQLETQHRLALEQKDLERHSRMEMLRGRMKRLKWHLHQLTRRWVEPQVLQAARDKIREKDTRIGELESELRKAEAQAQVQVQAPQTGADEASAQQEIERLTESVRTLEVSNQQLQTELDCKKAESEERANQARVALSYPIPSGGGRPIRPNEPAYAQAKIAELQAQVEEASKMLAKSMAESVIYQKERDDAREALQDI